MTARTRTRKLIGTVTDSVNPTPRQVELISETFFESHFPGSNNCQHRSVTPVNWRLGHLNDPSYYTNYSNYVFNDIRLFDECRKAITPYQLSLNWEKLPTSSKFGIIQFLAELDDSIAIFTKRFWTSLTYGSFTWGVLPFVQDLRNLLSAISLLDTNLDSFSYEDQFTASFAYSIDASWRRYDVVGTSTFRYSGVADLSFQAEASLWLDRLGFHPDLATVWDLVPLSFVLDWFIPVGSFLESLRGGGWIKVLRFDGWETVNSRGSVTVTPYAPLKNNTSFEFKEFVRTRKSDLLTTDANPPSTLFMYPSLTELFNTLYIFVLSKGTRL